MGDGVRTRDIRCHRPTLYQLSYSHRREISLTRPRLRGKRFRRDGEFAHGEFGCQLGDRVHARLGQRPGPFEVLRRLVKQGDLPLEGRSRISSCFESKKFPLAAARPAERAKPGTMPGLRLVQGSEGCARDYTPPPVVGYLGRVCEV